MIQEFLKILGESDTCISRILELVLHRYLRPFLFRSQMRRSASVGSTSTPDSSMMVSEEGSESRGRSGSHSRRSSFSEKLKNAILPSRRNRSSSREHGEFIAQPTTPREGTDQSSIPLINMEDLEKKSRSSMKGSKKEKRGSRRSKAKETPVKRPKSSSTNEATLQYIQDIEKANINRYSTLFQRMNEIGDALSLVTEQQRKMVLGSHLPSATNDAFYPSVNRKDEYVALAIHREGEDRNGDLEGYDTPDKCKCQII